MSEAEHASVSRRQALRCTTVVSKQHVKGLLLGQGLSLLITGTGISSQFLAERGVDLPSTQSSLNYLLLLTFYLVPFVSHLRDQGSSLRAFLRAHGWLYVLLAVADVEANFCVVMAYQYTSITSVMLLDCFSIPCVMVLSWIFLRARYRWPHFVGVLLCLAGIVVLVVGDHGNDDGGAKKAWLGDILCLLGAFLYSVSNVGQERVVRNATPLQFLAMIGSFGFVLNGIQSAALESRKWLTTPWSWPVIGYMVMFAVCMFLLYSFVPAMMVATSATFYNLSLLTSDVFAIVAGVFLFNEKLSYLYFVALVLTASGLIVFNVAPSPYTSVEAMDYDTIDDQCIGSAFDGGDEEGAVIVPVHE